MIAMVSRRTLACCALEDAVPMAPIDFSRVRDALIRRVRRKGSEDRLCMSL